MGLGTLADQNRYALVCVELPIWAALRFFFFTGSFLCLQRKRTMSGNETALFWAEAAIFQFGH
jgi:hypothetical protein